MFPLGNVLFPHAQLPLHVFEPRYRALAETCLAGDGEFGVVLIERGSEVGGGDTRFSIGTVARIVAAGRLPDGRYLLATEGTRRLRVREWLPDDPFPRAEVELLGEPGSSGDAGAARADVEKNEAALIDGASPVRQFFSITIPLIWEALTVSIVFLVIALIAGFFGFFGIG